MEDDIYNRVKNMIDQTNGSGTKIVIPDMSLSAVEQRELTSLIVDQIMKHSDTPEYHASILAENILNKVNEFIKLKEQETREKQNNPTKGGLFRRV